MGYLQLIKSTHLTDEERKDILTLSKDVETLQSLIESFYELSDLIQ